MRPNTPSLALLPAIVLNLGRKSFEVECKALGTGVSDLCTISPSGPIPVVKAGQSVTSVRTARALFAFAFWVPYQAAIDAENREYDEPKIGHRFVFQ